MRFADVKGYAYSRDDVRARALANAYSQAMGDVFTRELKPLEVEVIVAEVGDDSSRATRRTRSTGCSSTAASRDHQGFCVIGGAADELTNYLKDQYRAELPLGDALQLGRTALERAAEGRPRVGPREPRSLRSRAQARPGRKFRRLSADELKELLGG